MPSLDELRDALAARGKLAHALGIEVEGEPPAGANAAELDAAWNEALRARKEFKRLESEAEGAENEWESAKRTLLDLYGFQ